MSEFFLSPTSPIGYSPFLPDHHIHHHLHRHHHPIQPLNTASDFSGTAYDELRFRRNSTEEESLAGMDFARPRIQRVVVSCEGCQKRKSKCDRALPCSACRSRRRLCEWSKGEPCTVSDGNDHSVELFALRKAVKTMAGRLGLTPIELESIRKSPDYSLSPPPLPPPTTANTTAAAPNFLVPITMAGLRNGFQFNAEYASPYPVLLLGSTDPSFQGHNGLSLRPPSSSLSDFQPPLPPRMTTSGGANYPHLSHSVCSSPSSSSMDTSPTEVVRTGPEAFRTPTMSRQPTFPPTTVTSATSTTGTVGRPPFSSHSSSIEIKPSVGCLQEDADVRSMSELSHYHQAQAHHHNRPRSDSFVSVGGGGVGPRGIGSTPSPYTFWSPPPVSVSRAGCGSEEKTVSDRPDGVHANKAPT